MLTEEGKREKRNGQTKKEKEITIRERNLEIAAEEGGRGKGKFKTKQQHKRREEAWALDFFPNGLLMLGHDGKARSGDTRDHLVEFK